MAQMEDGHANARPIAAYPYGVRAHIHLQTGGDLGDLADIRFVLADGGVFSIDDADAHKTPWDGGVDRALVWVGFATEAEAVAAKPRLTQALCSLAIGLNVPILIQAITVFDRRAPRGMRVSASLHVTKSPDRIVAYLRDAVPREPIPAPLLLSIELFCSAQFQATPQAVFFAMVSALEPLAVQERKGAAAVDFLRRTMDDLVEEIDISDTDRAALKDGLGRLKRETIGQSLRRLAAETLSDDPGAADFVKQAYSWRSEIAHEGRIKDPTVNLIAQTQALSNWMRRLYGRLLPHPEGGTPR